MAISCRTVTVVAMTIHTFIEFIFIENPYVVIFRFVGKNNYCNC